MSFCERARAAGQLTLIAGVAGAGIVCLQLRGQASYLRIDWADPHIWAATPAEDMLVALVRLAALALAWWLLTTSALYTLAAALRAPAALRAVGWATLPTVRRLADRAAAAALVGTTVLGHLGTAAAAVPERPAPLIAAVELDADPQTSGSNPPAPPPPVHVVRPYDHLWSIAQTRLDDPYRWPDVWRLNQQRRFPDGRVLADPDLIHPGWALRLPADATDHTADGACPHPATPPPVQPALTAPPPTETDADPADNVPEEGGAPPAPETTPAPAAPETAPAPPSAAEPRPIPTVPQTPSPPSDRQSGPPSWVELPSGAVVGLSLSAAVTFALGRAWLHRRRRHLPGSPEADHSHDDPLYTDTVRRVRRAWVRHALADGAPTAEVAEGSTRPEPAGPPGTVTLARRGDDPVLLDLPAIGGLCLTGPSAAAAARAVVVELLADPRPAATRILTVGDPEDTGVLPDLGRIQRLDQAEDLEAALQRLETELVHRTRLLDADDPLASPDRDRDLAAPATLLLCQQPDPSTRPRLAAIVEQGRSLGVGALILGRVPQISTITLDAAARVLTLDPDDALPELQGARLCTLSMSEARDLLPVIAASQDTETPPPEPPAPPQPPTDAEPGPAPADAAEAAPVLVGVLGQLRIQAGGEEISTGLRPKARELIAYLILHPHGAGAETAADALWPDPDEPDSGRNGLWRAAAGARSALRTATGLPDRRFIDRKAGRYHPDPNLIDADLWRLDAALADARSAEGEDDTVAALERVGACYTGDLLEDADYDWAAPARVELRRRVVDALARAAELHEDADRPDDALAALELAIRHDPYSEQLYRRIMQLQASLGRPDAAHRTYTLLQTRLADLDAKPDPTTTKLHNRLTTDQ